MSDRITSFKRPDTTLISILETFLTEPIVFTGKHPKIGTVHFINGNYYTFNTEAQKQIRLPCSDIYSPFYQKMVTTLVLAFTTVNQVPYFITNPLKCHVSDSAIRYQTESTDIGLYEQANCGAPFCHQPEQKRLDLIHCAQFMFLQNGFTSPQNFHFEDLRQFDTPYMNKAIDLITREYTKVYYVNLPQSYSSVFQKIPVTKDILSNFVVQGMFINNRPFQEKFESVLGNVLTTKY